MASLFETITPLDANGRAVRACVLALGTLAGCASLFRETPTHVDSALIRWAGEGHNAALLCGSASQGMVTLSVAGLHQRSAGVFGFREAALGAASLEGVDDTGKVCRAEVAFGVVGEDSPQVVVTSRDGRPLSTPAVAAGAALPLGRVFTGRFVPEPLGHAPTDEQPMDSRQLDSLFQDFTLDLRAGQAVFVRERGARSLALPRTRVSLLITIRYGEAVVLVGAHRFVAPVSGVYTLRVEPRTRDYPDSRAYNTPVEFRVVVVPLDPLGAES